MFGAEGWQALARLCKVFRPWAVAAPNPSSAASGAARHAALRLPQFKRNGKAFGDGFGGVVFGVIELTSKLR